MKKTDVFEKLDIKSQTTFDLVHQISQRNNLSLRDSSYLIALDNINFYKNMKNKDNIIYL